ncbi:MAG: protein kinase, partial [Myxococcales bacterium]|nr:protein kinase [Myxococcales bacterium]
MEPDTRQTRRFRAETTLPPLSPHAVEIDEASQLPQRVGTGRFLGTPRYGVGRELGRGAFGVVYEAFDRQREKRVALKVLRELSGDALYRFKREFRSLSDVSHENLVELYELVSDGERWFFAMELVRGVTFLQHVAAPTHEQRLRRAMLGLARGVDALHRAAKLHCDIKPSNVLVGGSGQVKLLDFGLVTESQSSQRSADETVFGTVAYMAPEQAAGAASPASDWYAVGAMLYEALTGRLPFMGTPMQILVAKQHGEVAPIRDAPAELRDLATLAGRMLARDAKQRPEAEEILARLGDDEDSGPHRVGRRARVSTAPFEQQGRRFVGRRHELARLRAAYQRAAEREGAAVVVNVFGGSGMGKTTLVRHFLDGLREERDAVVLLGRCYEHESVPFKSVDSLIDSLCRYLRRLDSNDVDRLLPRDVRALARLFPVLDRVGSIARAPCVRGGDERQLRLRAFAALRELLARIADRASLVLWIDDMQWSDGDSHALLLDLLSQSVPPFLLIASYRSNSNRMPQLALPDATAIENVYIGALDKDDAHELARQAVVDARGATDADACSTASADDTAALVAREARGVPFLIGELARHHGAGNIGALRLDQLLVARVAALPPPARTLLEVVALAGRPIAKHIAARAACLDADGSDALAILARARMVQTRGSRWCLVETYHDSIRESVVEHLDASTRRHLHYRIALALEAAGVRDPEALLTHFRGAGDLSRAAQQAEVAARRAASHLAFDQAARMYSMALELTPEGGLQRAALREKLGIALANAGRAVEAGHELLAAAA